MDPAWLQPCDVPVRVTGRRWTFPSGTPPNYVRSCSEGRHLPGLLALVQLGMPDELDKTHGSQRGEANLQNRSLPFHRFKMGWSLPLGRASACNRRSYGDSRPSISRGNVLRQLDCTIYGLHAKQLPTCDNRLFSNSDTIWPLYGDQSGFGWWVTGTRVSHTLFGSLQ